MRNKIFTIVFFIVLLLLTSFKADAYSEPENCPRKITRFNNLQFTRNFHEDIYECWISIDNSKAYLNLIYRSYLITTDGLLMVFNSYGSGSSSTHTGARMFYFFPREVFTNEVQLGNDAVSIKLNQKLKFQFRTKTLNLVNQENFKVKTDPKISRNNRGGVEILKYNGVYLDVGFSMGMAPSDKREGVSVFKNQFGQSCQVTNNQIFDYKDDENYLHGDNVLKGTVARLCPDFKWSIP